MLVGEVADLPPGRAQDVGCGEGRNAIWLAERGWQVTGVDFSEVGLEKARSLAADRCVEVTWVRADLLDYQPDHAAFDLVLAGAEIDPISLRRHWKFRPLSKLPQLPAVAGPSRTAVARARVL